MRILRGPDNDSGAAWTEEIPVVIDAATHKANVNVGSVSTSAVRRCCCAGFGGGGGGGGDKRGSASAASVLRVDPPQPRPRCRTITLEGEPDFSWSEAAVSPRVAFVSEYA